MNSCFTILPFCNLHNLIENLQSIYEFLKAQIKKLLFRATVLDTRNGILNNLKLLFCYFKEIRYWDECTAFLYALFFFCVLCVSFERLMKLNANFLLNKNILIRKFLLYGKVKSIFSTKSCKFMRAEEVYYIQGEMQYKDFTWITF